MGACASPPRKQTLLQGGRCRNRQALRRVLMFCCSMRKLSVTLEAAAFVWMVKRAMKGVGDECGAGAYLGRQEEL